EEAEEQHTGNHGGDRVSARPDHKRQDAQQRRSPQESRDGSPAKQAVPTQLPPEPGWLVFEEKLPGKALLRIERGKRLVHAPSTKAAQLDALPASASHSQHRLLPPDCDRARHASLLQRSRELDEALCEQTRWIRARRIRMLLPFAELE